MASVIGRTRKINFRYAVAEHWGGKRALAAQDLGFEGPSLVTRYMTDGKSAKAIGHNLARKIEQVIGEEVGWMDVVHDFAPASPPKKADSSRTLEQRINELPDVLRRYILMELELCEAVQEVAPTSFMRAPTHEDRRAFQEYLQTMLTRVSRRRSA